MSKTLGSTNQSDSPRSGFRMAAKRGRAKTVLLGAAGLLLSCLAPRVAPAAVVFSTGNNQYDNVNISADTDALNVTGAIDNTGISVTFNTMIGPDFSSNVTMHCQHGVAFCESFNDSQPSVQHTGFSSITLTAQTGTTWDAGDLKMDQLAGQPNGSLTFHAFDSNGVELTYSGTNTFSMNASGQNPFQFTTTNGDGVAKLVIQANNPSLFQDIKQVSLEVTGITAPEPASLLVLAPAAGLLGTVIRRRRRA